MSPERCCDPSSAVGCRVFFCHGSILVVGRYLIFFLLSFLSSFLFFLSFLSFLLFLFVLLFMLLLSRRDYTRRRSLFSPYCSSS